MSRKTYNQQLDCIDCKSIFKSLSIRSIVRTITWPFRKIWNGCVMNIESCACGMAICFD